MGFKLYKDQLGTPVEVSAIPSKVVSLVPSQTELLFDLGLGDQVIGVTKFCIHPKKAKSQKVIIGGTKNFHFDVIHDLSPDLIIGNKEENYLEGITELKQKYPVWMSDVSSLQDALNMISAIGEIFNVESKAYDIISSLTSSFKAISLSKIKATYLIWHTPIMAAGRDTFIDEMLRYAGFENIIKDSRYPELTETMLKELNPEVLLLSSEPFPFKEKHIIYYRQLLPQAKIVLVDGELFSWYGSRLLKAPEYFNALHASLHQ